MITQRGRYYPPKSGWAAELLLLGALGGLVLGAAYGLFHAILLTDAAARQGFGIAVFFALGGAFAGLIIGPVVVSLGIMFRFLIGRFARSAWIEAFSVGLGTAAGALAVYFLIPWGYPMSLWLYIPLFVIVPALFCGVHALWARLKVAPQP